MWTLYLLKLYFTDRAGQIFNRGKLHFMAQDPLCCRQLLRDADVAAAVAIWSWNEPLGAQDYERLRVTNLTSSVSVRIAGTLRQTLTETPCGPSKPPAFNCEKRRHWLRSANPSEIGCRS
jgi:hypothetical protein